MAGGLCLNYIYGGLALAGGWRSEHGWVIWWGFVNMILVFSYSVWGFLRDFGFGWRSIIPSIFLSLTGIGMGIYILMLISLIAGIVVIGIFFYIGFLLALYLAYLHLNKTLPNSLVYLTMVVFLITSLSVMIVSYALNTFNDFLGFSITYLIINVIILGYGGYLLYSDISSEEFRPNFFSPYGLPVYKFDSNTKTAIKNNFPTIMVVFGMLMLLFLSLLVQIFVEPVQIGVSLTVVF